MNALKDKYKRDLEQLRTSMNEFDPCGLIALESPVDEYDCKLPIFRTSTN
jgi:hypothetical protein